MAIEQSLRLPARLRGVVRADGVEGRPVELASSAVSPPPVRDAELDQERRQVDRLLASLGAVAADLRLQHQAIVKNLDRLAVELAWSIAAKFLGERLQAGEFPIEDLVKAALERLEGRQSITISLHPDDLAWLRGRTDESFPPPEVQMMADATLRRGDCRAKAGDIGMWAGFADNLTNLREQLLAALEHGLVGGV